MKKNELTKEVTKEDELLLELLLLRAATTKSCYYCQLTRVVLSGAEWS